jgi:hypothetical protein
MADMHMQWGEVRNSYILVRELEENKSYSNLVHVNGRILKWPLKKY